MVLDGAPAAPGGAQMTDDRFPVQTIEGVPVVAAPEEIDVTNADGLRSALLAASADGYRALVVDMTRTRFCDSSALYTLVAAHKRAAAAGRAMVLAMTGDAVLRVFALTGMDQVIPSYLSLPEALARAAGDATPKTVS